jgi:RimJ/RimL family protein N-acetyltransferase
MEIMLRPPTASDADAIVQLSALLYPERPEPAAAWRTAAEGRADQPYWIAVEPASGALVGYACARNEGTIPLEHRIWRLFMGVAPEYRQMGAGSRIFDRLLRDLQERQAAEVRARVRHSSGEALAFLLNRGFTTFQQMLYMEQDLTHFSAIPPEEPLPAGLTATTLAAELTRNREAALREAHDLYCAACADIPSGDLYIPVSFENYTKMLLHDSLMDHDCFFLAKEGDRYIGMSYAARMADQPHVLGHRFTGVRREYRGQHVARALKLLVTRYALIQGYQKVTTATLEANAGMRAVNARLGFAVTRTEYRLRRRIDP